MRSIHQCPLPLDSAQSVGGPAAECGEDFKTLVDTKFMYAHIAYTTFKHNGNVRLMKWLKDYTENLGEIWFFVQ